jgi:hypothetical protein
MLPLNVATNAPRRITLAGRSLLIAALPLRTFGALQSWILDHVAPPVPLDESVLDPDLLTPDVQELLRFSRELALAWPPRVASRAWFVVLESADGGRARLAWEALRVHQPGFTEAEAAVLVATPPSDPEWDRLLRTLLGLRFKIP